jgi:hypothetical protein
MPPPRPQIRFASDVKHVMEFFWNTHLLSNGYDPQPGSTHGRVVEELYTVSGSIPRPPVPQGSLRISDANGRLVLDLEPSAAGHQHQRRGSNGEAGSARRGSFCEWWNNKGPFLPIN